MGIEQYIEAAHRAGCPKDQIDRFAKAGYIATPEQLEFHALARQCDAEGGPTDCALGGSRGGMKSHAILAQVCIDDCQRVDNLKFLFLRKTQRAAVESFADLVGRVLSGVPHTFANGCITVNGTNSKVIIGGYQDESDIDHYVGIEYDGLIVEERTQISAGKLEKLYGSIRTSKLNWRPRKYSSANPGGIGHNDFVEKFIVPHKHSMERDTRFLQTSYRNNPFLDSAYVAYLDGLSGQLGKMWRDGSWDVYDGQFFMQLGDHNKEVPFTIPPDSYGRVWMSLDHGITHNTSAGIWFLDNELKTHRIFSYSANGGTTQSHALAIWDMIESCKWLSGIWPDTVYYDPSMQTKRKMSESMYVSDIGIYQEVFAARDESKHVQFLPANNRKVDGCHILGAMLDEDQGVPELRYFEGTNKTFTDGLRRVLTDKNNAEVYAKADGDDEADEARYGAVAGKTRISTIQKQKAAGQRRERTLAHSRPRARTGTWMGT